MAKIQTLCVWPNPFHMLDHEGNPSAILPYEPEGDGVNTFDERRFVGAQLKAEILQKFPAGDGRQTIQRTTFVYVDEPVTVKNSPYYRRAILSGELIAANEETSKRAGQTKFVEPAEMLEQQRKGAIQFWELQAHEHHEGNVPEELTSFSFGPMPEAVKQREAAKKEATKGSDEKKTSDKKKTEAMVRGSQGGDQ